MLYLCDGQLILNCPRALVITYTNQYAKYSYLESVLDPHTNKKDYRISEHETVYLTSRLILENVGMYRFL